MHIVPPRIALQGTQYTDSFLFVFSYPMQQKSWEANSSSPSQDIPVIIMEPQYSLPCSQPSDTRPQPKRLHADHVIQFDLFQTSRS